MLKQLSMIESCQKLHGDWISRRNAELGAPSFLSGSRSLQNHLQEPSIVELRSPFMHHLHLKVVVQHSLVDPGLVRCAEVGQWYTNTSPPSPPPTPHPHLFLFDRVKRRPCLHDNAPFGRTEKSGGFIRRCRH